MSKGIVLSQAELNVTVSLEHNPIPVVDSKVGVNVLLEINPVIPDRHSEPLDICFVVDCSGSMGDQVSRKSNIRKIRAVRDALTNMLHKMSPMDRIRVIGFSDEAFVVLPWTLIGRCDIRAVTETLQTELCQRRSTYFAEALTVSLDNELGAEGLPVVVLLTDGQSSAPGTDYPFMVSYADKLRAKKIPLIIYGTGPDYNLNLLQQLAIRAGNGSLLYHVLSVEDLESHLTGEMAFLHGHCLENVHVSVFNALATFDNVFRFVPQEQQLQARDRNGTEQNDGGSYLSEKDVGFENACGALDHMRGQKFLFHLEMPLTAFQEDCLFNVVVTGNKPGEPPFRYVARVPALCTAEDISRIPPNTEVETYLKMIEASKAVRVGNIDHAAQIYKDMGQVDLAQTLVQMRDAGEDDVSTSRGTESFASSVLSTYFAQRIAEEEGKKP